MSLVAARFLLGIGEGSAFPTATRALANWMAADRRGFAQGITHAAARLGNALTPPLIAFLIVALSSWRDSFIIIGVISFAWVGLWWFYFRDDPREHKGVTEEEIAVLPPVKIAGETPRGAVGAAAPPDAPGDAHRLLLRLDPLAVPELDPSYFLHQHHLDIKKSAIFASGVFFAGVVGDTVGGVVSDKILRRTGDVSKPASASSSLASSGPSPSCCRCCSPPTCSPSPCASPARSSSPN